MERPVPRKAEVGPCGCTRSEGIDTYCPVHATERNSLTAQTSVGRLVDEKITDVVRLTVAACAIVMESDGVDSTVIAKMRARTFQILGVKERRN